MLAERLKDAFHIGGTTPATVALQNKDGSLEHVPATKVVYEWESDGLPYKGGWLFTQYENTQFSIRHALPARTFSQFEAILDDVQRSLIILGSVKR